jgi:cell wall-associated NlpC family hydrolase
MADTNARGQVSLAGLGIVSAGALLIWTALNDPPNGVAGALRDFLMHGQAQAKLAVATVPDDNPSGGVVSGGSRVATGSAARVVDVARQYLGDPYLWGGASHRGIDCSGLVLVAYRDGAGIKLPHFATSQAAMGKRVGADQVQPGDLVCWGVPGNFPHIALALNQDRCIAAWTYGVGVKEGPIHQKAVPGFGYPYFYRIL